MNFSKQILYNLFFEILNLKIYISGVRLCYLVEALRKKPLKPSWNKRPMNQHHYLENVTCALSAIEQDGIKLVNIGE